MARVRSKVSKVRWKYPVVKGYVSNQRPNEILTGVGYVFAGVRTNRGEIPRSKKSMNRHEHPNEILRGLGYVFAGVSQAR